MKNNKTSLVKKIEGLSSIKTETPIEKKQLKANGYKLTLEITNTKLRVVTAMDTERGDIIASVLLERASTDDNTPKVSNKRELFLQLINECEQENMENDDEDDRKALDLVQTMLEVKNSSVEDIENFANSVLGNLREKSLHITSTESLIVKALSINALDERSHFLQSLMIHVIMPIYAIIVERKTLKSILEKDILDAVELPVLISRIRTEINEAMSSLYPEQKNERNRIDSTLQHAIYSCKPALESSIKISELYGYPLSEEDKEFILSLVEGHPMR